MNTINDRELDHARTEWEFQTLREQHANCCAGAIHHEGRWINVICPVLNKDGTPAANYRSFTA